MFSVMQNGGMFMYIILGVSIVGLALFIERGTFLYFKLRLDVDKAFKKILHALEKKNYRDALKECSKIENHPVGRILKEGLLKSDQKDKEIERAMEAKLLAEIPIVKKRINYLAMIANIATLLGLLGTILGLITAFEGVSGANAAMKQEILARGISVAMLTTAFGLVVAVPSIVGFYLLNNRGDYLIEQFDEKALRLFNVLSSLKKANGAA